MSLTIPGMTVFAQSAATTAWSGISQATTWACHTALPALNEGFAWVALTAVPAAGSATLALITQICQRVLRLPQAANTVWTAWPTQIALAALVACGARQGVNYIENNERIRHCSLEGRIFARFIAASAIAAATLSFGGLFGLTCTSYHLYIVATAALAALNNTTIAFLNNAINTYEAQKPTLPIFVQIPHQMAMEQALARFDLNRYAFSGNLGRDPVQAIIAKATSFPLADNHWIGLADWMAYMSSQTEQEKATALAIWAHLVHSHGPLPMQENVEFTVRYNRNAWSSTITLVPQRA